MPSQDVAIEIKGESQQDSKGETTLSTTSDLIHSSAQTYKRLRTALAFKTPKGKCIHRMRSGPGHLIWIVIGSALTVGSLAGSLVLIRKLATRHEANTIDLKLEYGLRQCN